MRRLAAMTMLAVCMFAVTAQARSEEDLLDSATSTHTQLTHLAIRSREGVSQQELREDLAQVARSLYALQNEALSLVRYHLANKSPAFLTKRAASISYAIDAMMEAAIAFKKALESSGEIAELWTQIQRANMKLASLYLDIGRDLYGR